MKEVFLMFAVVVLVLFTRMHCYRPSQSDLAHDCKVVCDDVGYDHDFAIKTGVFSYECVCKRRPPQPLRLMKP